MSVVEGKNETLGFWEGEHSTSSTTRPNDSSEGMSFVGKQLRLLLSGKGHSPVGLSQPSSVPGKHGSGRRYLYGKSKTSLDHTSSFFVPLVSTDAREGEFPQVKTNLKALLSPVLSWCYYNVDYG